MFETLLPYWIAILSLGFFFIALRKGWLRGLFSFMSSIFGLFFNEPAETDLLWEVRKIRRTLQFFYFLTWLGIVFGLIILSDY